MAIPLLLDIDGVLITTPPWQPDEMDKDGYSKFNATCVSNLNTLLKTTSFRIYLSSSRRRTQTLEAFNQIFKYRNIYNPIYQFLPDYPFGYNRLEEIQQFIQDNHFSNYLIIDDDKSLHDWSEKDKVIITSPLLGFDATKLTETLQKLS